jgi:hypothetical protein
VTVRNLRTGAERVYVGFTPAQAVVAAYYQTETGNDNTYMYDWSKAKVTDSGKTVVCGEWVFQRIATGLGGVEHSARLALTKMAKQAYEERGKLKPTADPRFGDPKSEIARWEVAGGKRSVVLYHEAPYPTIRNVMDKGPYIQRTITNCYTYQEFKGSSSGSGGTFYVESDAAALSHMEANFLKYFRMSFPSLKRVK